MNTGAFRDQYLLTINKAIVITGILISTALVKAEKVEEEVITLDPSGMLSRTKVMVEKKTGVDLEKQDVVSGRRADSERNVDESVPFLAEERVSRFASFKDCWVDDGRVCLKREPVQSADGCVVLEAEEGKIVQPEDGRVAVGFDEKDGCRYVAFLSRAEYVFEVKTDGAYQAWYRSWFPARGYWNHSETLDRGTAIPVVDSEVGKQPDKEWVWYKGPVYNLKAGFHQLALDFHAGARMDKIVLAPTKYEPNGKGLSPAYNDPPPKARVETVLQNPPSIEKWYRLNVNTLDSIGQVESHYSLDSGKTWKPVPSNGNLSGIGTEPAEGKGLKLAFDLKSSPEGVTPMLLSPVLKFVGKPPLVLGNDKIQILFSKSKGNVVGIRNLQSHSECIVSGDQGYPIVELTLLKDKTLKVCPEPILTEQNVEETKTDKVLTQKYQWLEGKLEAVVTVALGSTEKAILDIHVINRGENPVVHVDFPRLSGMRIGTKGDDDYFCIPSFAGNNLFKNPGNSPLLWKQSPWMHPMKWVDIWDSTGGLYVSSHDATFRDTAMLVGEAPQDSIKFLIRKLVYIIPGKDWMSQPYIVSTHAGDWHWAAKEYGDWARTCMKPPDNPRWLKEEFDGFYAESHGFQSDGFTYARKVIDKSANGDWPNDYAGNRQGFDALAGYCTLFPYPCPAWGGAEELSQSCDMIKQMGGHSIWYINWLLTNPRYATQARIGVMAKKLLPSDSWQLEPDWMERALARAPSGKYTGNPPPTDVVYHENKLCDETAEFSKYKVFWADKYVRDFHADGIYWDCLLLSYGDPCYDPAHHVNGNLGNWGNASTETLRKIVETTRAADPHAFHMGENIAMVGVSQFENMMSGGGINDQIYRYTFPDWIIGGWGWNWGASAEGNFDRLNQYFLTAARVMNQQMLMEKGKLPPSVAQDYSLQLLRLRQRVKQIVYPATFRDTDGLEIELPAGYRQATENEPGAKDFWAGCGIIAPSTGIRAKRYTLEREGTRVEALNVLNTDLKEGGVMTLRESTLKLVRKVWSFDVTGKLTEIPIDRGGFLRIPVPVAVASTVVLVENCEPLITIQAPSYGTWEEKILLKVKILNLNERNISGRLYVGKQDGFNSAEIAYGPIAPGEEKIYDLELTAKKGVAAGRHDVEMIAEGDGLKANRLFWIYIGNPLRLAIYPNPERLGVDVQLENFSAAPVEGTCVLTKDKVFKTSEPSYAFKILAGGKTKVTLPLDLKAPFDMVRLARLEIKYGQYTVPLVKSLAPPVANPDFEIDLAGDGHPDFWIGWSMPGNRSIGYSQWGLDSQNKYAGKTSVWINPPGLNQTSTCLVSNGGMIHLGEKYRVKVAIRREVASDKVCAKFNNVGDGRGGGISIGEKGTAGVWEEFEGVWGMPRQNGQGLSGLGEVGTLTVRLENGSSGKAWFDSIRIEVIP